MSELGAVKKRLSNGRLVYLLPKNQDNSAQFKIAKKAIQDFVVSVEAVSNQVIVKTTTAAAQVIAESIDNLYIEDVIASLAGDNVVLIITPNENKAKEVAELKPPQLTPGSRFGSAIENLGDIHNDGFEDFVVSAPYFGDDKFGAIFIYRGNKDFNFGK